ncbi:MAG: lamin tail domain-containing protein, partial [Phycisphaerae bacterium]
SPGTDDYVLPAGSVVINEVLAHSNFYPNDLIELHNTTDETVDIGGWFLSDSSANMMKYVIAAGTQIAPGGYIVFTENDNFGLDQFGQPTGDLGVRVPFAFSEIGEDVYLASGAEGYLGGYREHVDFSASPDGATFGRYVKSTGRADFTLLTGATPGGPNDPPIIADLVINEVMYYPGIFHEDFSAGGGERFTQVRGGWLVARGRYVGTPLSVGSDTIATVNLTDPLGSQYVLAADVNAAAASGGYASNAAVIFDYHGPTDFKFARLSVNDCQWQIGRRNAGGWVVYASVADPTIDANDSYDLELRVTGSLATLVVDGSDTVSHDFGETLNDGSLGLGTENARASFGMVAVEPVDASNLEYIELYNRSGSSIDLTEFWLSGAIGFTFGWYDTDSFATGVWTLESGATATWAANLAQTDTYEVFVYVSNDDLNGGRLDLDAAAAYEIFHSGGPSTVVLDQNLLAGNWASLGTFPFDAGEATVTLTRGLAEPDKRTIADRIKFVRTGQEVVADNSDLSFQTTGTGFTALQPGGYVVLASSYAAFDERYDMVGNNIPVAGQYTGRLDNNGETVKLRLAGVPDPTGYIPYYRVDHVYSNDGDPWPIEADGNGSSLSRQVPGDYGNEVANWGASIPWGTPGTLNIHIDTSPPSAPS